MSNKHNKKADTGSPVNVSEESVDIELQQFLIPISIIISGVLIAASVFFSVRGLSGGVVTNTNTNPSPTAAVLGEPDENGFTPAVVNIADAPLLGNRDSAKVAIVEFSDFECPFCQRFHNETFDQIIQEYVDTGKAIFVYRDFPLSFHNPEATNTSLAARCVFEQAGNNGFFKFTSEYYARTLSNKAGLPEGTTLASLAGSIEGVNVDSFNSCYSEKRYEGKIATDIADGSAAGITGTPGFIIGVLDSNGNVEGLNVPGAQPFDVFKQVIDEQLAR